MKRHPVFYALPFALAAATGVTLLVLQLAGAKCYTDALEPSCNDLADAQHEFVAPIGFTAAGLLLLLVLAREVYYWRENRKR